MPSQNSGVLNEETVTKNIENLTNADNEPLSTWTGDSDIDVVESATVVGHDDKSYNAKVDHANDRVIVLASGSGNTAGADPGSDTNVGEIKLRLEGRR